MDATAVWTVVVVLAALIAIGLVFWYGRRQREAHLRAQADELREQLRREDVEVRHREAVAAETAARARIAQAESEAKAAEAARLQSAAEAHRSEAVGSREELEQRRRHAESLDPVTAQREARGS